MPLKISYLFILSLFVISCEKASEKDYQEIAEVQHADAEGYLGDQSCVSCHEEAYDVWKSSHHDLAMQELSEKTVLGDFNDVKVSIDGVDYHFYRKGEEFWVNSSELDGSVTDYRISYVFGLTPLQQYLIDFPNGKKQVLRATWDTVENKWFHQYAGDSIEVNDWLHWTNGAQNWNTMCAECHSTNLKKDYFVEKDSFHTTYSSINVSCESCHGPGKAHVIWANGEMENENMEIILGSDQQSQLNMCAPCHARRVKLTKNMTPGTHFEDQYLVQNISSDFYYQDGQILEEDYVYGSFLQSKMYDEGVRCGDCHNIHSMELKLEGNLLCNQCHVSTTYDNKSHHFHEENTEAAQCINCHMTGRYYMGNDFRRDHSFRIPRPDQSMHADTPNACNECHDDQSEKWAADWIVKWYGDERPPHFSDYLILSYKENMSADERKSLDHFINDLNYPYIARSTVINNLVYTNSEQVEVLLEALKDSSATIRYQALLQFRMMTPQDRNSVARKHINDSTKLVRIGAAQLLLGFDGTGWTEAEKVSMNNAKGELETMLFSNADFSTGRLQMGDYFMQTNDIKAAIKHYEVALEKDSLLYPVYSNLATAYSIDGQTDRAFETLNSWIDYEPNAGRPYYLRALLNFESGSPEIAVQDLKMAIELNPEDLRSMYNLATYYYQNKEFDKALKPSQEALKLDPDNQDLQYLYALILKETGRVNEANQIMNRLQTR